ncbi:MAG TPA: cytochrome P450 [Herpetosiphonaceae bacterium]
MTQTAELDIAASESIKLDLAAAAFKANPYPTFARLRMCDPVHRYATSGEQSTWLITRYGDADLVLQDARFVKDRQHVSSPPGQPHIPSEAASPADLMNMSMVDYDPPDHTRLRSLLNPFFTPRQMEQRRERIQAITNELIDAVIEQGHMDIIDDFASVLPMRAIAEILGVPAEDCAKLHLWTKVIADSLGNPASSKQAGEYLRAFYAYLVAWTDHKRQSPGDDVISALLQAEGEQISPREVVTMAFLLLTAGHDTADNLIGNGMLALLTHPEQLELLRDNPALIKPAVEEFVRYRSPFLLSTMRWAREDVELGGKLIRQGDAVLVSLSAANHDETVFAQAGSPDVTRPENRHLAFGKGIHYCLGAPLARLEGQIAIGTLVRRLPQLRLAVDPETLPWRPGWLVQGLDHLPVVF